MFLRFLSTSVKKYPLVIYVLNLTFLLPKIYVEAYPMPIYLFETARKVLRVSKGH